MWWHDLVKESYGLRIEAFQVSRFGYNTLKCLPDFSRSNSCWGESSSQSSYLLWCCVSWCKCPLEVVQLVLCSVLLPRSHYAELHSPEHSCSQTRRWCSVSGDFSLHHNKKSYCRGPKVLGGRDITVPFCTGPVRVQCMLDPQRCELPNRSSYSPPPLGQLLCPAEVLATTTTKPV